MLDYHSLQKVFSHLDIIKSNYAELSDYGGKGDNFSLLIDESYQELNKVIFLLQKTADKKARARK